MIDSPGTQTSLFWPYLLAVCRYARGKAVVSLLLLIVLGLAQGIGLFMIIPLLHLIGLGGAADSGGVTAMIARSLARLGLPLTLPAILGVYVALVASSAVASRFRDVLNMEIVQGFTYFLRNDLYEDLTRVDWLSFTRIRAADLTHVLTVGLEMVGAGTQQLLLLVSTLVIAAVNLGVAFSLSPAMTALALGTGALLLLLLRPFNRQALHSGAALHQARQEMFAVVTDHLNGMKVAKSYGLEKRYAQHFRIATGRLVDQFIKFVHLSAATRMFYEIGAAVALSVLFLGAVEVIHLPAAYVLLLAFLFARLLPQLSQAQQCYQRIRNMLPSYGAGLAMQDRLVKGQEPRCAPAGRPLRLEQGIELRGVSFRYDQTRHDALHQVDLMIPARHLTAITGPSGAGKSTLADLIMGLLTPDRGQVLIDGPPWQGRDCMIGAVWWAMCPRRPFFSMTRSGSISFGSKPTPARKSCGGCCSWLLPRSSCPASLRVWTRWWATGGCGCPGASGSDWPWPGRCCAGPPCCCWTRPPATWMWKTNARFRRPCGACREI